MMDRGHFISLSRAARACGVSASTLKRWLESDAIKLRLEEDITGVLQQDLERCLKDRDLPMPESLARWPRILVVEDESDVRSLLAGILRPLWRDPDIRMAGDGFKALRLLKDSGADLVVTDLMMPDIDGLSLCRAILQMPDCSRTRIVAVTALKEQYVREAAFDEGAVEFLRKPLDPRDLRDTAVRLLGLMPPDFDD